MSLLSRIEAAQARQTVAHPPRNGCTLRGLHPCILTTGQPVPPIVPASPFTRRALAGTLPAKVTR